MARRGRVRFVRVKGWVSAELRTKDDASKGKKARWRVAKSRISILFALDTRKKGNR